MIVKIADSGLDFMHLGVLTLFQVFSSPAMMEGPEIGENKFIVAMGG